MSDPLFTPALQTDNPVTVVADPDVADDNPNKFKIDVGGIVTDYASERYKISWPQIKFAKSFELHGSVSPQRKDNVLQTGITGNETVFIPPVFTEVITYYFWVTVTLDDGSVHFLDETPATLENTQHRLAFEDNPITFNDKVVPDPDGLNCELENIYEFIRAGNQLQLQMDGEPALLFLRRQGEDKPFGVPCACNNSIQAETDPDYQGRGRCTMCFKTGIYGGYYPSIPITIRYSNMPEKTYKQTSRGQELSHQFNTFMIWAPVVRYGDLVVRLSDGSRYHVTGRRESSARAIMLHQEFDLAQVETKDIRMQVTDANIQKALNTAEFPGFLRDGFKAFG